MPSQLTERLTQELEKIAAFDIYSNVRADEPSAASAADVMLDPQIMAELLAAGMPDEKTDEALPSVERVKKALPYFARVRNTATFYCMEQIVQDLFGVEKIDESSLEKTTGGAKETLARANVERVMFTVDWWRNVPEVSDLPLIPSLRLDTLINEPHQTKTIDRLGEASGESIYEAGDLRKAVKALIGKAAKSGCRAFCVYLNPKVTFERGNRDAADRVLSLVMLGQRTNPEDRKALRSFVMSSVLEAAAEQELTLQLMLGVMRAMPGEKSLSAFEPDLLRSYAELFSEYSSVNFDVFLSNVVQSHELAVLSMNYSNVYTSGIWWHTFYPSHIERTIRERIEMLPMTKSCAFLSDAHSVEWIYGTVKLLRRVLARTLAEMIEENLLGEDTAIDVARHYLKKNPLRLYFS